jgi:2-polyprenyl-3-methyl-5-hydroxy-6-metoxy-1,4-benzoquinol methylase
MSCYLCNSENYRKRPGSVRDDLSISILECSDCSLVYLSSLNHIKKGHYENSGMHDKDLDIKIWLEDTRADDERRFLFLKDHMINKDVLDFGCGNGGFLSRSKNSAKSVTGVELELAMQSSFKSRGINVFENLDKAKKGSNKWNLITAFHVVEHLSDPISIIRDLSILLAKDGEIIIEVPSSEDALLTLYENQEFQNFTYWSQHLFLFNAKTLQKLIKKSGLKLNWIKHVQRYSIANHLHWLSKGKPEGHKKWFFLDDDLLNIEYGKRLAEIGKTDTIIASLSLE